MKHQGGDETSRVETGSREQPRNIQSEASARANEETTVKPICL